MLAPTATIVRLKCPFHGSATSFLKIYFIIRLLAAFLPVGATLSMAQVGFLTFRKEMAANQGAKRSFRAKMRWRSF
tara:strand:- start:1 stop:228 length:228 start_codon:yes stop_codon:yes gene_type:complete